MTTESVAKCFSWRFSNHGELFSTPLQISDQSLTFDEEMKLFVALPVLASPTDRALILSFALRSKCLLVSFEAGKPEGKRI